MAGASLRVGANTSEFTKQMRSMLQEMKLVTSEYKVEAAAAKALGSQTDLLQAKKTELTNKIRIQTETIKLQESNLEQQKKKLAELIANEEKAKQKVADLTKAREESVKATGKDSEESQKLNTQLEQAKEKYARATNAIKKEEESIAKNTVTLNNSKAALVEETTALKNTEEELEANRKKWTVFGQEIQTAGSRMDETGNKTVGLGDIIKANLISSAVINGVKKLADGVKQLVAGAISVGSDFESGMSLVASTMGMTTEEIENGSEAYEKLEQAAKDAGNSTQFSATQAAEALNYMALAGYDADKAVETLPTVLNLAAAGGMDLATASDMVTDSMSALGDSAGTTESFVDKMAKTSQKSNTSVQQLGEAILTVGGTAKDLAGGVTEANTVLGIFADNGVKGAEGGTALRNVILSLTAPTDKAKDKIDGLGLKIFDAHGNMRPLNETFKDLDKILGDMNQGEKTEVLNTIFNKTDLKSVNALLANCGQRFDELSGYIDNADGAAENMAATMNDNLQGKVTILKSGLEGLGIAAYEKFENPLKNAVTNITNTIGDLQGNLTNGELSDALDRVAIGFGNLVEKASEIAVEALPKVLDALGWIMDNGDTIKSVLIGIGVGFGVFKVAQIINATIGALQGLKNGMLAFNVVQKLVNVTMAANPIMLVITLVATLAAGIIGFIATNENARKAVINAWNKVKAVIGEAAGKIASFFTETIPNTAKKGLDFLEENWKDILLVITNPLAGAVKLLYEHCESFRNIVDRITSYFKELPGKIWNAIVDAITRIKDWGTQIYTEATNYIQKTVTQVVSYLTQLPGKIWNAIVDAITRVENWGQQMLNRGQTVARGFLDSVYNVLSQVPGQIHNAIQGAIQSVISWGSGLVQQGRNAANQLTNSVINGVSSLPSQMATVGHNIVTGVWNGIVNAGSWFQRQVKNFFKGIVDGVKSALGIHSPSRVFADEVGKYMAQGAGVGFTDELENVEKDINESLGTLTKKATKITPITEVKQNAKVVELSNKVDTREFTDNSEKTVIVEITNITELDGKEIARKTTKRVVKNVTKEQKSKQKAKGAA